MKPSSPVTTTRLTAPRKPLISTNGSGLVITEVLRTPADTERRISGQANAAPPAITQFNAVKADIADVQACLEKVPGQQPTYRRVYISCSGFPSSSALEADRNCAAKLSAGTEAIVRTRTDETGAVYGAAALRFRPRLLGPENQEASCRGLCVPLKNLNRQAKP